MTKRYQRGNQKASIEKGQTILLPKDINGVNRSFQLKRERQYYDQKIATPLVSICHSIVSLFK
jgi:hypothetical protein